MIRTCLPRTVIVSALFAATIALTLPSRSFAQSLSWSVAPTTQQRAGAAAIWDPVRHRMIMFGGYVGNSYLGDLIALDSAPGSSWTPLAASGTPPNPRDDAHAIYDPLRDRLILFGGHGAPYDVSDVWALSLSGTPTWTPIVPAGTAPSPRFIPSVIYDPIRDRLLVFGGERAVCPPECCCSFQWYNEVWELSLSGTPTWTQLTPAGSPPPGRYGHVAIYDPIRDRMVVYGGWGDLSPRTDLWALSLAGTQTWSQLLPTGTPPPSYSPTAIYDPISDRMLVYGGYSFVSQSDQSTLTALSLASDPPGWSELDPAGVSPPGRNWHSAVYDPGAQRMVWTGGEVGFPAPGTQPSVPVTETYSLDLSTGAVATLMSVFEAVPSDAGIEIRWQFTTPDDVASVTLERATQTEGPWAAVDAVLATRGDMTVAQDRSASPGATTFYRLVVNLRQGGHTIEGPVSSAAAAILVSDLTMLAPNPASGATRVDFAVARQGAVRISVADVAGRERAVLAQGKYAAGRYSIRWDGRAGGAAAPAGIYFLRFEAPGATRVRKLVML